jgi:hypothetical protein
MEELAAVVSLKLLPSSLPGVASAMDEDSAMSPSTVLLFFSVVVLQHWFWFRLCTRWCCMAAAQSRVITLSLISDE